MTFLIVCPTRTHVCTTCISAEVVQSRLNEDLEKVHRWLLAKKLTLNIKKTEYMSIGSRQRLNDIQIEPKIKLGDTEVNKVSKTKTFMWCIVCIACMVCKA